MPWKIVTDGGQYSVVNADTGKVMHTYDDHKAALAYLKALYANAGGDIKKADYALIMKARKDREPSKRFTAGPYAGKTIPAGSGPRGGQFYITRNGTKRYLRPSEGQ